MGHREDAIRCKHISTDLCEQGPVKIMLDTIEILPPSWREPQNMQLRVLPCLINRRSRHIQSNGQR